MIEIVRVSKKGRDQLILLKRHTGIPHWNTLCRWAFCTSLAEPHSPPAHPINTDSPVEMTWRVFAGKHEELYWALLKQRCRRDGLPTDRETLSHQFKLHLHRGIAHLAGDKGLRSVADLVRRSVSIAESPESS